MHRNKLKFCVWYLNTFSFPINGISISGKNTEFGVVSTHAVKIWDHLNENWSGY